MARRNLGILAGIFYILLMCYLVLKLQECGDQLKFVKAKNAIPQPVPLKIPNIVFLETSGRTFLKARDGCALESAALHNPERTILHYSTVQIASDDIYKTALKNVSNLKFELLDKKSLFTDTPLYTWFDSGAIKMSSFPIQHMSDAIRLALLWKTGGIYLDTDMISIRSLGDMHNALGFAYGEASNCVLAFQSEHPFLINCMELFARNYIPRSYSNHGPGLVTRVLQSFCKTDDLSQVINYPVVCRGITLLPERAFCVFAWNQWMELFQKGDIIDTSFSYTVHMYSKMSGNYTGLPGDGSLIDTLSKNNCPNIYQLMVLKNKV